MEDDVDRQGEMRKLIRLAVVRILIHTRYELIPGAKEKSTMECQERGRRYMYPEYCYRARDDSKRE